MVKFISFPGLGMTLALLALYGAFLLGLLVYVLVCLRRGKLRRAAIIGGVSLVVLVGPTLWGEREAARIETRLEGLTVRPETVALEGKRLLLVCQQCAALAEMALRGGQVAQVVAFMPYSHADWQPGRGVTREEGGKTRPNGAFWRWTLEEDASVPGLRYARMKKLEAPQESDFTLLDISTDRLDGDALAILGLGDAAGEVSEGVFLFEGDLPLGAARLLARLPYKRHAVRGFLMPFYQDSRRLGDWQAYNAALERWLCGEPPANAACHGT